MKKYKYTFYTDKYGVATATAKADSDKDLIEVAYKMGLEVFGIKQIDKNIAVEVEIMKRRAFERFDSSFRILLSFKRAKKEKKFLEFLAVELYGMIDLLLVMKLINLDESMYLNKAINFIRWNMEVAQDGIWF